MKDPQKQRIKELEKQLAESLALHQGLRGQAARARIVELLTRVGIRDPEQRLADYPHQFSGGQRQRISIARALCGEPDILLADEAVSALDMSVQAQVLELLARLIEDRGLTLLFVTHDLSVVRGLCDRVAVLNRGELVEHGPTERVWSKPESDYTRRLIAAAGQ